jgi:hypothetical protein
VPRPSAPPDAIASRRFLCRKPFDAGLTSGYCISYFHGEKAGIGKFQAGLAQDLRNGAAVQGASFV